MADENTTQDPKKALQERVDGIVRSALEKHLRTTGREGHDPRQDEQYKRMMDALPEDGQPVGKTDKIARSTITGFGRRFVQSEEFKRYSAARYQGASGSVRFGNLLGYGRAASLADVQDIQEALTTDNTGRIIDLPTRQLSIRDLMTVVPTTSAAITFLQQTGFTSNAAPVPPNQANPATAVDAPQDGITYDKKTYNVATIMTHMPLPREQMEDAPALEGKIEAQMRAGLYNAENIQIIRGDGASPNMRGILNESARQKHRWQDGDTGDNRADAVLYAMVKAMIAQYDVDGSVLNPIDWMKIVKMKDKQDNYLIPSAHQTQGVDTLWGQPVVKTNGLTVGTGLTGAFATAAILYDRMEAELQLLDQHSDWATKRLLCLLGTIRSVVAWERPESLVEVTFDQAPA